MNNTRPDRSLRDSSASATVRARIGGWYRGFLFFFAFFPFLKEGIFLTTFSTASFIVVK